MDAPLARAMMRKCLDEEFAVELPGGPRRFTIVEIRYEEPARGDPADARRA
jgi:transcription elongation factor GreB